MQIIVKKAAALLAITLVIGLAAITPLLAGDQGTVGLISAADLAFIRAEPQGIGHPVTGVTRDQTISLISSADLAFISRPFSATNGRRQPSVAAEAVGMISGADYQFLTRGGIPDIFTAFNDFSDSLAGKLAK